MQQPITTAELEAVSPAEEPTPVPWLTGEKLIYIGLALLGLVLRLAALGAYPLSDAEAGQALVAWRILQAQPVGQAGYSPLIVTLDLISFLLLGGSEFAARLGPALLSVPLVLLPYGLRRYLGRTGALAAGALFALSPTVLYFSRTVDGDIGVAAGGLALVVGLFNWLEFQISNNKSPQPAPTAQAQGDGQASNRESPTSNFQPPTSNLQSPISNLYLAAGGLVLMLTASPSAYSMLALLLGFLALAAAVGGSGYAETMRAGLAALRSHESRVVAWGELALGLGVGLVAIATGLLFNLGGLAATADLLTTWLMGFEPGMVAGGAYPAVFLLSLYEPLILLAGLFGLSVVLMRRRLIDLFLGWWFFGGIALDLLRSGRTDGEVLVSLVPLVLLAGLALGMLWDSLAALRGPDNGLRRQGVLMVTGIGLVIAAFAYTELMKYTREDSWLYLLPLAATGLFIGLVVLFWMWDEGRYALQGAALVAVTILLAFTIGNVSRLDYARLASPYQPLVHAPVADGLPLMVTTLQQVSNWWAGDAYSINIVADRHLGAAVEWQLHRFRHVTWVDSASQAAQVASDQQPVAVLLPSSGTPQESTSVPLGEGYIGQDFAIRANWTPAGLSGPALVRWIVLRTAVTPVIYDRAVLWVKPAQGTQSPAAPAQ
jgi:hypothetical protein